MKQKKIAKTSPVKKNLLFYAKFVMMSLTVIFSAIVILAGSGLIYNHESYGKKLTAVGVLFIISALAIITGGILACFKKNIASLCCTVPGIGLCMYMLYLLADHADRHGWSDKYTMEPISSMYISRIVPIAIPAVIIIVIALIQFFSYECSEARREKRRRRLEKENEPAPPII